jgi:hypothetical protein
LAVASKNQAQSRGRQILDYRGTSSGDPLRASEATIATVELENPPLRRPLGSFAYDLMQTEIETEGWRPRRELTLLVKVRGWRR